MLVYALLLFGFFSTLCNAHIPEYDHHASYEDSGESSSEEHHVPLTSINAARPPISPAFYRRVWHPEQYNHDDGRQQQQLPIMQFNSAQQPSIVTNHVPDNKKVPLPPLPLPPPPPSHPINRGQVPIPNNILMMPPIAYDNKGLYRPNPLMQPIGYGMQPNPSMMQRPMMTNQYGDGDYSIMRNNRFFPNNRQFFPPQPIYGYYGMHRNYNNNNAQYYRTPPQYYYGGFGMGTYPPRMFADGYYAYEYEPRIGGSFGEYQPALNRLPPFYGDNTGSGYNRFQPPQAYGRFARNPDADFSYNTLQPYPAFLNHPQFQMYT
jgi:hypothetical protein